MNFQRAFRPPAESFFLLGPRGTGKSTLLRERFPDKTHLNLLDEAVYQQLLVDPSAFANRMRLQKPGSLVWIDEIQRLPNLLNEVHRWMEERRLKFAMTGSSARKLRRGGANLLAGRALSFEMYPFLPEEMGSEFSLDTAMRTGTIPIVYAARNKQETLKSYVQMYLKEEIQAEALVRNLPGFARFLPIAALAHGQVLNVSSIARDAGVARPTVADFISILEDTLLAYRLSPYESRLRVRERKHPKFYWIDPGLVRATKRNFDAVIQEEMGPLFEGFVAMMLKAYRSYRDLFDDWYYWAPTESAKVEVDFLLKKGRRFVAIEAKSSTRLRPEDLVGLKAIAALPQLSRRILVYRGNHRQKTEDGIDVLPFADFAEELAQQTIFS